MSTKPKVTPTEFGFDWGPAKIVRASTHQGDVILEVRTDRASVAIRVTPTGLIRIGDVHRQRSGADNG